MQFAWGYAPTLILETALQFKIFDELVTGPLSAAEVARRTGTSTRGVTAIMDALTGLEFLQKEGQCYKLTPESEAFLVSSKPGYCGAFFYHTVRQLIPRWMDLPEAVTTGKAVTSVNQQESGAAFFAQFVESLFPLSYPAAKALAGHLGMTGRAAEGSVLDIGAGSGVWGIALAENSDRVRIHAVDWPAVLEVTRKVAARHGLAGRLTCAGGDLLEADFGTGHRVATIGHIFHSEGVERSRRLIKRTYDALAPGGTIAIAEWVPNDERTGPPGALLFAVNMLVHTDEGNTFTFVEMSQWLGEAGFEDARLLEVPGPNPLVLANRPR